MTIAVTGATGLLGNLVITNLLKSESPASIVAIARNVDKAAPLAEKGVQVRQASYTDPAALETALQDVDTLLLVSGSEVGHRVAQHGNVINAAKTAGVQRIVYTSAPKADTTFLVLAPEHKATEELILASGIPYTILRNNWYTDNYAAQIGEARNTGAITSSAGNGRVASASRVDFAEAAASALIGSGHENKVYELTGDYAWDFVEFAAAVSEIIGSEVVYKPVSTEQHIEILKAAGLPEEVAGFVATINGDIARGALADVTTDLRTLIGRPTTPLIDGLRHLVV